MEQRRQPHSQMSNYHPHRLGSQGSNMSAPDQFLGSFKPTEPNTSNDPDESLFSAVHSAQGNFDLFHKLREQNAGS